MKQAYCSSYYCDPMQKSAKGTHKPNAVKGKSCDCGGLLVWHEANSKYRPGIAFCGNNIGKRREELFLSPKNKRG